MASSGRAAPLWIAGAALLGLLWLLRLLVPSGDEAPAAGPGRAPAPDARPAAGAPAAPAAPALPVPAGPADGVRRLDAESFFADRDVPPPGRRGDEAVVALELHVRHAHGGPAAGVGVVLARGGRVLSASRTDAEGRALLDGVDGEAELYLGGVMPVVHQEVLGRASGRHELQLPRGETVEGRVTVDGRAPDVPLPIALSPYSRDLSTGVERMLSWPGPSAGAAPPWPVRRALRGLVEGLAASTADNAQLTGPDGAFLFSGLPAGWGAVFEIPEAFRWADAEAGGPRVVAPASGVRLELSASPRVSGRVVAPGGARAVPGAEVRWTLVSAASHVGSVAADARGRFAIPLTRTPVNELQLRLRDPGSNAYLEHVVTGPDAARGVDLGDLELQSVRRIAFRAVDLSGQPVPGAVAVAEDRSGARSPPTDAEGRSVLSVGHGARAMVVWAHRHLPTEVALPEELPGGTTGAAPGGTRGNGAAAAAGDGGQAGDRPGELRVVLPGAATFDIHVVHADGEPARHVEVHVSTEQALFERPDRLLSGGVSVLPEATAFEVGTTRPTGAQFRSDSGSNTIVVGSMTFAPDRDGLVTLSALRPEVPFTVTVRDRSGAAVWGPETLNLQPGEARALRAVLPYTAVDLVVRVRDAAGRAVAGANVTVRGDPRAGGDTDPTRADGTVTFRGLYATRLQVVVEKPGFALGVLQDTGLPPSGVPLDVTLLEGRDLTVLVRDPAGASVAADRVWAVIGAHTVSREELPAVGNDLPAGALFGSQWTLTGLPDQPVVLRARLGQRVVELAHDPRGGVATIVIGG